MSKRFALFFVLAGPLLFVAGCSPRLEDERTTDLTPDKVQKYATPSPIKELTVSFESDKEPVSVYVVDSANEARETESLTTGKTPTSTLGKKEKTKKDEIKIVLNEKKLMSVLIVCEKSTRVKVKLSGR